MSYDPEPEERSDPGPDVTGSSETTGQTPGATGEPGYQERILRRSREDRVVAGICGGLGRYLEVDPVLFRIAFVLSIFAGGIGLLIYIVLWIAVPEYPSHQAEAESLAGRPVNQRKSGMYVGGFFVLVGILILLRELVDWFDTSVIASLVLIGIGAFIVIRGMRGE